MKSRSRWVPPNERYAEPVAMALRAAYAEPTNFRQGARVKGQPMTPAQRQRAIAFKAKARSVLP